jgi:hypothetical protein
MQSCKDLISVRADSGSISGDPALPPDKQCSKSTLEPGAFNSVQENQQLQGDLPKKRLAELVRFMMRA